MSRLSPVTRQRLLFAAKLATGGTVLGAASFHLLTRRCYFEPLSPENGQSLLQHPLLKQINPYGKPGSSDSCVREVPFSQLDADLLEDARRGGSKLIERFTAGAWGGPGFTIQRSIMQALSDPEATKDDIWSSADLLSCTYEPGTYFTNHFLVLSKTPTTITMRGCFDPHELSPPYTLKSTDNIAEMHAALDERRRVAVLKLRVFTFDGRREASEDPDPFGGFAGWLHRRYSTLLVEMGASNCMK